MSGQPLGISGFTLTFWAFAFVLTLCRTGAAIMVMPGLGEIDLPVMARAGVALSFSVLVLPIVLPLLDKTTFDHLAPFGLAVMVVLEITVGLLIGWLARLIAGALAIAGQLIAVFSGLSSVLQPDPALGASSSAIARLMNLIAPLLLLVTGAYLLPLRAIMGSYDLLPPGAIPAVFFTSHGSFLNDATHSVVQLTERSFILGFELSAPFLIVSTAWQIMLGIMTRLLPTLQVYGTAAPLQIAGGIGLLCLLFRQILTIWEGQAFDVLRALQGL